VSDGEVWVTYVHPLVKEKVPFQTRSSPRDLVPRTTMLARARSSLTDT
jgi:hypothetical protein